MIITVTPNPAVDQTMFTDRLVLGTVNRARETQLDPAGKGVNASRVAHRLGWPTIAFGFLAGETGRIVESALDAEGVQYHFIHVAGRTRVNMTVIGDVGEATSVLGPGPVVASEQLDALGDLLDFWLQGGTMLVLAGSLPPGAPDDWYAALLRRARARGVTTLLDAHGAALRQGLEAQPSIIKPNRAEAEDVLGRELNGTEAVLHGARELAGHTGGTVIISTGGQGAVCVHGDRAWLIVPPRVELKSTVGSGDSFVAGLTVALARGDDLVEGLRLGAAAGAATAGSTGTSLGTAAEVAVLLPHVRVEPL